MMADKYDEWTLVIVELLSQLNMSLNLILPLGAGSRVNSDNAQ